MKKINLKLSLSILTVAVLLVLFGVDIHRSNAWYSSLIDQLRTSGGALIGADISFPEDASKNALIIKYGRVGIGTTTPSSKMEVVGDLKVAGNITVNTNGREILISSYTGANSSGGNIFIGGGGQSSVGAIGSLSLGSSNSAYGLYSLYANTTGYSNAAYGSGSLGGNTTGNENAAMGTFALSANTSGSYNTASGYQSLWANTTGAFNTASGYRALFNNTTGTFNTAMGLNALYLNATGTNNTAFGSYALDSNTTGT